MLNASDAYLSDNDTVIYSYHVKIFQFLILKNPAAQ